ncbi:K(+)/H(+) antiporter [Marasmius crinis-equi]|uniref:K(+)/H(+) antiporter n=1 Tax=Marasmius crinis-equi TaxID=585013 RepID=A0ABR3F7A6_9AGAR
MGELSSTVISILSKRAAPDQGGLLNGKDPTAPNNTDPIRLWIIQLGIIVTTASLLSLGLQRIRQPRVIAEVLGGILLGKTAFGRIPGFTQHIFPDEAKGYLSLTANIGLCLFLFLVGLEIDGSVIKRNVRLSATVGLAGMTLPFGFGVALSVPLYNEFIDSSTVKFTHFMLFTGVAYSITAFPVLCRILTELKLLDTTVGVVVLSAGVANDIIGWTLLALSVALVNAGSGLTALYVLLVCVGWTLIVLFPLKYALRWLGRKTGSIETGHPTMFYMTVIVICVFGSAFFTDIIGVHAIFGAFLVGLVVPREGGLAIVLTEKLEDMVGIIFLPLYFTLSGLSTDLGLLNDGKTWGFTLAICSLAFTGKFGGCTLAARYLTSPSNFSWRESCAIGSLMSCKGLVELIVLNVGLSAGILSQKVFSMFVLEALVLTFMTTPLVLKFYPPDKRVRASAIGANFNNVADTPKTIEVEEGKQSSESKRKARDSGVLHLEERKRWTSFIVVLDTMEHLPGLMAFTKLVKPSASPSSIHSASTTVGSSSSSSSSSSPSSQELGPQASRPVPVTRNTTLHPLRLLPLSDRLLSSTAHLSAHHTDPVLMVFRMFTRLLPWPESDVVEPKIEVIGSGGEERVACVVDHAVSSTTTPVESGDRRTLIMLGWLPPAPPVPPTPQSPVGTPRSISYNPFDALFRNATRDHEEDATMHTHFVRGVFGNAGKRGVDVGLFVELAHSRLQGFGGSDGGDGEGTHVYLPFFGGPDDRLALEFIVQLCEGTGMKADIVWVKVGQDPTSDGEKQLEQVHPENLLTVTSVRSSRPSIMRGDSALTTAFPDTVYASMTKETRIQAVTADAVIWDRYASIASSKTCFRELNVETGEALRGVVDDIRGWVSTIKGRKVVVTGRSRRLAVENHVKELKEAFRGGEGGDVRKTVGDVAAAIMSRGTVTGADGLVVIQAGGDDL